LPGYFDAVFADQHHLDSLNKISISVLPMAELGLLRDCEPKKLFFPNKNNTVPSRIPMMMKCWILLISRKYPFNAVY